MRNFHGSSNFHHIIASSSRGVQLFKKTMGRIIVEVRFGGLDDGLSNTQTGAGGDRANRHLGHRFHRRFCD